MKNLLNKIISILKTVFGYGIMIALFAGGLSFFGYLAALIIGGPVAETICIVIYEKIIPVLIYISTSMVLLGLLVMYLSGETALTSSNKKNKKEKN